MSTIQSAQQVLDRHFLEMRCAMLDLAAMLDRLERSDGGPEATRDARFEQLQKGLDLLKARGSDRAERIQMLFSDAYEEGWRK